MNDDHRDDERPLPAALDPRSAGRSTRSTHRRRSAPWIGIVRVLCGLLSVILLGGAAYGTILVNRVTSSAGTLETTEGENNTDRLGNSEDINILVVGNDSRQGYTDEELAKIGASNEESMATDTIMLIHVPANGKKIRVVSFPRDSYVDIPGVGKNKINAAYVNGYVDQPDTATADQRRAAGQQSLIATVSQLSGLKIDHYVEVTLLGFYDLTQSLGGIEVNLCQPAYDPSGDSGADFPAGQQVLDGSQALSFVRQRKGLPGGDLDRIKRQQYFFGAVIRKVLDQGLLDLVNVGKLTGIIDALTGTISYDQDLDPLLLADQMSSIAAGNVEFMTIPLAEYPEQKVDGMDVLMLADQKDLDKFFGSLSSGAGGAASSSSEPVKTTDPAEVSLDVYNGTTVQGAGSTAAQALTSQGFTVENTLSAATTDWETSVVQYPKGMEVEAATVAAAVPGSTVEESDQVDKVILVVGANYPDFPGAEPTTAPTEPATPTDQPATAADAGCIN